MPVGLLEVRGTIDVAQFWPDGTSDADTTKVLVQVDDSAFQFRPSDQAPFKPTRFYAGAKVKGRTTKSPLDKNNRLTIRLQGIDAPELHYEPSPLSTAEKNNASAKALAAFKTLNHIYRQPLGPTTTNALHDLLVQSGQATMPCRVVTRVDRPNEVFDTYGRMVGDLEVTLAGKTLDINHYLVEHGWAFPTFYSSMNDDEINALLALTKQARSAKRGVWKSFSKTVGSFDFSLLEPKKGDLTVLANDRGPVLFPKLFRRLCSWAPRKKAKVIAQSFQQYLEAGQDACFETTDFLANGINSAKPRFLASFVKAGKAISFEPQGLVFQEATSRLVGPDNQEITSF